MAFHIQHYTNFLIQFVFSDKQFCMNNEGKLFNVEESLFSSYSASSCYEEFDSILYLQCSYRAGIEVNIFKIYIKSIFLAVYITQKPQHMADLSPLSISKSHLVFFYTSNAAEMRDIFGVLEVRICCHFHNRCFLK